MQDPDAAKIVAGYKAYSAYSAKDLEGATKSIQESIEKLEKMDLEASAKNEATAGLKVVIELVNRDLKIVTAMAQIQGYLKELGDKIAADANAAAEAEKK